MRTNYQDPNTISPRKFAHSAIKPQVVKCPPHARGGAPMTPITAAPHLPSAPRSWGCSVVGERVVVEVGVRPTLVGVLRSRTVSAGDRSCPPHARGGAPAARISSSISNGSAPRSWGCSVARADRTWRGPVRPTLVGVLRFLTTPPPTRRSPPHARGGAPWNVSQVTRTTQSAPRSWGCSASWLGRWCRLPVRPTLVGVLRVGVAAYVGAGCPPHARGGAPSVIGVSAPAQLSAPRSWGCSGRAAMSDVVYAVRPTLVGVLRSSRTAPRPTWCPPHARGGAPSQTGGGFISIRSAPRSWGCSGDDAPGEGGQRVRPTLVGVLRPAPSAPEGRKSPPHARGGAPDYGQDS